LRRVRQTEYASYPPHPGAAQGRKTMTPAAVEMRGVELRLGRGFRLEVPELQVAQGEFVALLGPNGAGKSTLLRTVLGLLKPAAGVLRVLGEAVPALRGGALAALRRRIGYVPQLLPARSELPMTLREVVAIGRTARAGLGRRLRPEDWAVVDAWLERLGLAGLAARTFAELSGGEQRKALLARAMTQEPELLLLDEPAANLDLGWREQLVTTLEALYGQTRLTVVLVCHELEVLPPACHRVVWLENGRPTATGTPEEIFHDERVCQLYGEGLLTVHAGGRHAVVPANTVRHGSTGRAAGEQDHAGA